MMTPSTQLFFHFGADMPRVLFLFCIVVVVTLATDGLPSDVAGYIAKEDKLLLQAAQRATGIFQDKTAAAPYQNTVIVTAASLGYAKFLENWLCRAESLRLRYLVVSLDSKMYQRLTNTGDTVVGDFPYAAVISGGVVALHDVSVREGPKAPNVSDTLHHFRKGAFNVLSCGKMKAVGSILEAGLDVIFIDPDVVLLRPPTDLIQQDPQV